MIALELPLNALTCSVLPSMLSWVIACSYGCRKRVMGAGGFQRGKKKKKKELRSLTDEF